MRIDVTSDFEAQQIVPGFMTIPPNGAMSFWLWFKPTSVGARQGAVAVQVEGNATVRSLQMTGVGFS